MSFSPIAGVIFEGYGSRMAADDFDRKGGTTGFSVAGGLKDVGHMQTLAAEKKVRMSHLNCGVSRLVMPMRRP